MTRIVGGRWAGRSLTTPRGSATRPTSEKVRGAVANAITARALIEDAAVLDLFAGSGAMGLELASRGAARITFVDSARPAGQAIRTNIAAVTQRRDTSYEKNRPQPHAQLHAQPQPHSQPASPPDSLPQPDSRPHSPSEPHSPSHPQLTLAPVTAAAFARTGGETFDIVFADPPYDMPLADVTALLAQLWESHMLAPDAELIVEHAVRSGDLMWPEPLIGDRVKRYGDTMICYGHAP